MSRAGIRLPPTGSRFDGSEHIVNYWDVGRKRGSRRCEREPLSAEMHFLDPDFKGVMPQNVLETLISRVARRGAMVWAAFVVQSHFHDDPTNETHPFRSKSSSSCNSPR